MTHPIKPFRQWRVLIVEDEALIAMAMADGLEEAGLKVVDIAVTLTEAFEAADGLDFDTAVFDVHLRGELSYPAAQAVVDRGIPVIFLSGARISEPPPGLAHVPVLNKPCEPATIAAMIDIAFIREEYARERMLV